MELNKENILRAAELAAEQADMDHSNGPNNQSTSVPPQPVPTSVRITATRSTGGTQYIAVTLSTPVGQNTFFFDPESADKIADGLKDQVAKVRRNDR